MLAAVAAAVAAWRSDVGRQVQDVIMALRLLAAVGAMDLLVVLKPWSFFSRKDSVEQAKEKGGDISFRSGERTKKKSCEGSNFGEVKLFAMSHGLN